MTPVPAPNAPGIVDADDCSAVDDGELDRHLAGKCRRCWSCRAGRPGVA